MPLSQQPGHHFIKERYQETSYYENQHSADDMTTCIYSPVYQLLEKDLQFTKTIFYNSFGSRSCRLQ